MKDIKNSQEELYSNLKTERLVNQWRPFELVSAANSFLGIIFALIDYELSYSSNRSYHNCESVTYLNDFFRYLCAITTLISIICLVLRYIEKLRWKKQFFKKKTSYLSTRSKNLITMLAEILILLLFPYPSTNVKVYIPLRINFDTTSMCYTLAEILYSIMFLRLFMILRALINYSSFQNEQTRADCSKFGVKANVRFSLRSMVAKYPIYFIGGITIISLLTSALALRIYERPAEQFSIKHFNDIMTSLWFTFENLSCMGYGDYFPVTYSGKAVSIITVCLGINITAVIISTVRRNFDLDRNQAKVFKCISKIPQASLLIKCSIRYYICKKQLGPQHPSTILKYIAMLKSVKEFKRVKKITEREVNQSGTHILHLKREIGGLNAQVKQIDLVISQAIKSLDKN